LIVTAVEVVSTLGYHQIISASTDTTPKDSATSAAPTGPNDSPAGGLPRNSRGSVSTQVPRNIT
jgi:hypothetical protein